MTRTGVVTITRGRDAHLHRQRLGLAAGPSDLHVVVGMGERPALPVVAGAPPVAVVEIAVPDTGLPLAAARNAGAATAIAEGAEVIVFLDVDCIPGRAAMACYRDTAGTLPGPAVLCGPVSYLPPALPDGYPADGLADLAAAHPARPAPPAGEVWSETRWELFWSLSFAVTAADWITLGGFCEQYSGYGGEDTDFAFTAAARGATLFWVGGATAFHQHHPPSRTTPGRAAEIVRNATLFRRRHGWWPMAGWLAELADAGVIAFAPDGDTLELRR